LSLVSWGIPVEVSPIGKGGENLSSQSGFSDLSGPAYKRHFPKIPENFQNRRQNVSFEHTEYFIPKLKEIKIFFNFGRNISATTSTKFTAGKEKIGLKKPEHFE